MLRRRLLTNFAPVVLLLLAVAVAAIMLVERSLWRLEDGTADQAATLRGLRSTVIVLTIAFVVLINVAVALLLRAASLVVRPVEQLVAATRALGEGKFDHRVTLPTGKPLDEFAELADALNSLAARLEAGERRQMETLAQVALAMNHELNNAIAIIELQLKLLSRRTPAPPSPEFERCLTQIHASLGRVTQAVRALQNARRIVLTDYLPGMKMLDLARSQLAETSEEVATERPVESV